jgi:hypothetical protein
MTTTVSRKLVIVHKSSFNGWGCSECSRRFTPSAVPSDVSLGEKFRLFHVQRGKDFIAHICAESSGVQRQRTYSY